MWGHHSKQCLSMELWKRGKMPVKDLKPVKPLKRILKMRMKTLVLLPGRGPTCLMS